MTSRTSAFAVLDPRTSWVGYLVVAALALSLVLVALGPAVSAGLPAPARAAFWLAHVGAAMAVLEATQSLLGRWPSVGRRGPGPQIVLGGLLGGAAFVPVGLLLEALLKALDVLPEADPFTAAQVWAEAQSSIVPVATFWVLLNTPRMLIMADQRAAPVPSAARPAPSPAPDPAPATDRAPAPAARAAFLSRLPRAVGREVVALAAELHYLRVHTTAGHALILMPFGQAVAALAGPHGLVVHRSHWVDLRHVLRVETDGGRCRVVLDNGLAVPVSRPHRAALRRALANLAAGGA